MINSLKKRQLIVALSAIITLFVLTILILIHHKNPTTAKILALPDITDKPSVFTKNEAKKRQWRTVTIQSGDTLKGVFAKLRIPTHDLWQLLKLHNPNLTALHPNEKIDFLTNEKRQLLQLNLPLAANKQLQITRDGKNFRQNTRTLPTEKVVSYACGKVETTLANAAKKAGLNQKMYAELVKMFEGQVNFRRAIHQNDRFAALYQEEYRDGHKIHGGKILAAELNLGGKIYQAVEFTDPKNHRGYYTPSGHSVQARFLSYPLQFKRISSGFSRNRLDPVLHQLRPHLGVDFAAPRGTPIRSIGNGRIIFIGKDHGYGNTIKIRYDRHYSALYAHMKHFANGLKLHQSIKKNQIIGYVGSSGWSTGPHLHFGFFVNGSPKNWLALKPPKETAVPARYRKPFHQQANSLLAVLKLHHNTEFAANDTTALIGGSES